MSILKKMKKIEIVIDDSMLHHLTQKFDISGFHDYTVVHDVEGQGDRGLRLCTGMEISNAYLILVVDVGKEKELAEMVQPILTEYGGICLISDVQWVKHGKEV